MGSSGLPLGNGGAKKLIGDTALRQYAQNTVRDGQWPLAQAEAELRLAARIHFDNLELFGNPRAVRREPAQHAIERSLDHGGAQRADNFAASDAVAGSFAGGEPICLRRVDEALAPGVANQVRLAGEWQRWSECDDCS